jgi:ribonuclease HI
MKNSKRSKRKSKRSGKSSRPSTGSPTAEPLSDVEKETLEELLARLKIKTWDILLIGDGSGSNWSREAGWASVSIEKVTMERLVFSGLVNRGTVNLAEMMAYVQPLDYFSGREADRRKQKQAPMRAFQVHIITDSDYCRRTGSSEGRMMDKNAGLWAVFGVYARHGFVLNWHHVRGHTEGEGCALNQYCDKLSKLSRKLAKANKLQDRLAESGAEPRTVYEINPSEVE